MKNISNSAYCLMHPTRLKIIETLKEEPRNVTKLATALGLDRSLVCYHLSYLQTAELLESSYTFEERNGKKWASRQYSCSEKIATVIAWIKDRLSGV